MHNKLYPQAESVIAPPALYRLYGRFPLAESGLHLFKSKLLISHRRELALCQNASAQRCRKERPHQKKSLRSTAFINYNKMATPPYPSLMIYRKGSPSPSRSAPGTKGVLCLGLGDFSRRRFMDGLRSVSRCDKHPFF